ncbi:hypothetical protein CRUP_000609 [Coryphaenoides rupestris]|nr:hypothetical protein CRUP_000609 [Coryphaenoides rupestris]
MELSAAGRLPAPRRRLPAPSRRLPAPSRRYPDLGAQGSVRRGPAASFTALAGSRGTESQEEKKKKKNHHDSPTPIIIIITTIRHRTYHRGPLAEAGTQAAPQGPDQGPEDESADPEDGTPPPKPSRPRLATACLTVEDPYFEGLGRASTADEPLESLMEDLVGFRTPTCVLRRSHPLINLLFYQGASGPPSPVPPLPERTPESYQLAPDGELQSPSSWAAELADESSVPHLQASDPGPWMGASSEWPYSSQPKGFVDFVPVHETEQEPVAWCASWLAPLWCLAEQEVEQSSMWPL